MEPGLTTALGTLAVLERLAWVPQRDASAALPTPGDVQFDLDPFIAPPVLLDGAPVRFGPIHTVFATAQLASAPTRDDQLVFQDALATIEQAYPWRPDGVFTHVAYGLPYFWKLPPGLFALHVPRLMRSTGQFVLEEAVPGPTDVHPGNPQVRKVRFHVPLRIERNDLLITLRGDDPARLADVLGWLGGSDALAGRRVASPRLRAGLSFTTSRAMFVQMGLPRKLAAAHRLPFAEQLHPRSPEWLDGLWMDSPEVGAEAVTFAGSADAQGADLTTARPGDYFDHGAIQHLSHDILDLQQFYSSDEPADGGETFAERVRCAFRSPPSDHLYAGTARRPMHRRVQGPGFDAMDVPGGSHEPKLQFSIFVPMSELCAAGRAREAELDLRCRTVTRRQNFLVPPRRHRAFPLVEFVR